MENDAELPSYSRPPLFLVGQNSQGNWVVQDQTGARGGLFVDRTEALKFARSENGNRPPALVIVNGILELDLTNKPAAALQARAVNNDVPRARRVA
jgi:hypothetical protein